MGPFPEIGIDGVRLVPLTLHHDPRGWLFEAYRDGWMDKAQELQVNVMWSRANVLRGPHVHGRHTDWFVIASGESLVGLKDARRRSDTRGAIEFVRLHANAPAALVVPPGVIHGVYFPAESLLVTVESSTYDPEEEFRCRWNDPALEIAWPFADPCLSDSDRHAPSYADMLLEFEGAHAEL